MCHGGPRDARKHVVLLREPHRYHGAMTHRPERSRRAAIPGAVPLYRARDAQRYCGGTLPCPPLSDTAAVYASAAAAEVAGLRPCTHCRPELSGPAAAIGSVAKLARRAATMMTTLGLPPDALPAVLGVSQRRVHAAFASSYGVTPADWAATARQLLALRLLGATRATPADIASACAYASADELERALWLRYGGGLQALRAERGTTPAAHGAVTLPLAFDPPYAWTRLLSFLQGRTIDGCEEVTDASYRRTLRAVVAGEVRTGWISAHAAADTLELTVSADLLPALPSVLARAWHAFDLGAEPRAIAKALGPLARGEPGLRLPGTFDAFELAVRAILGQQITVKAARTLASRFVAAFGAPASSPWAGLTRVFPTPTAVAGLSVDAVATLGIIGARARSILALATALAESRLTLAPGGDLVDTVARLKALPGIGEWTAQYVAMRALSAADAFPHTDYGVMKALNEKNPRRVLVTAEPWRPYRAYAVMHLWRSLG